MHAENQKYKNLALFDFDGTLCNKDSFTGFIFYALSKRHIVRKGIKILPWIQGYYLKLYPAPRMRARLYKSMFRQAKVHTLQALAQQYVQQYLLPNLNPALLAQLRKHQALGDDVVLVSASIDIYLKPLSEALNIALICTEVETKNEHYNGVYRTPDCSSEQKKLRILAQYNLEDYAQIYAYGNSEEDLAMLSLAQQRYMVGENTELPALPLPDLESAS